MENQIVSLLPDVPSSYHEELHEKGAGKLLLCRLHHVMKV
jgi:hypothetical protein